MSRQQTKRARFAAMAKIDRQNRATARAAHIDLMVFGTAATWWDGDRLKRVRPSDLFTDAMPAGARVDITHGERDQRAITSIWYDELAKLNLAR
jgi:hypothetical protein